MDHVQNLVLKGLNGLNQIQCFLALCSKFQLSILSIFEIEKERERERIKKKKIETKLFVIFFKFHTDMIHYI